MKTVESGTLNKLGAVINENLPHILTGVASMGVIATAYETAKAAIAVRELDQDTSDDRKASAKAKSVIKAFFPAIFTGMCTIGCIVSSDIVHTKRYTSLLGACMVAKTEIPKCKEKIANYVNKEKKVTNDTTTNPKTVANPKVGNNVVYGRKYLVVDAITGHTFKATVNELLAAESKIASIVIHEGRATLEEFYSYASEMVADSPAIATDIQWEVDGDTPTMNLQIDTAMGEDNEAYLIINYDYSTR